MSLPPNYLGRPREEQHRTYRNICIDLKKAIRENKEAPVLEEQMERFLSASKEVQWPHHNSGTYHKDEAEKAVQKVANEYRRFARDGGSPQDLLDAIALVETMIDQLKVR